VNFITRSKDMKRLAAVLLTFGVLTALGATAIGTKATDTDKVAGQTPTATGLSAITAADAAALRNAAGASSGVFPIGIGGTGASTAATARANLGLGHSVAAYAAGTGTLTATFAAVSFSTTNPVVVLDQPGTWRISARVQINSSNSADQQVQFKLRRTNNSAADIANSAVTFTVLGGQDLDHFVEIPLVYYTTANANDSLTVFGFDGEYPVSSTNLVGAMIVAELVQ
jgi:hypothetical protein